MRSRGAMRHRYHGNLGHDFLRSVGWLRDPRASGRGSTPLMTMQRTVVMIALLWASIARASPIALETYTGTGFSVSVPRGWKVVADEKQGTLVANEDPTRKDAALLMLIARAVGPGQATEDQVLDVAVKQLAGFTISQRAALPGGRGHALIADGTVEGAAVRAGVVVLVESGRAVVGMLAARSADFDRLGALQLVVDVMASLAIGAAKPAPPPARNPLSDAI